MGIETSVAIKAIYTVSIIAKSASSNIAISGVNNALNILCAAFNPSSLNRSTIDIFVMIQPAIKVILNKNQPNISNVYFVTLFFFDIPNSLLESDVPVRLQSTPTTRLTRAIIPISVQLKGIFFT
ncbi:MAG: hypothetical protein IPG53_23910 [Ignavibacteriales bacterium]|nr:hypothetical protein [Ignavibacteriales bacterium]